jgi:5-methyltetrahydrofolate--homocysteine methyltransferase
MNLLTELTCRIVVGDGAMGTELQRAGLPPGECGDRWTLEHPDRVEAIHRAYVEAGSDVILTNTFGTNRWVLDRYGLVGRVEDISRRAAGLARQAAGRDRIVLGDIGPSGQLLEPLGSLTADDWSEAVARQVRALLDSGADGIIIETMTALEEATLAVEASVKAGAPVVVASMAFDKLPDGRFRTMMGVSPEQAAATLVRAGASAVGANCGARIEVSDFASLVRAMRSVVAVPLAMQPNAGLPHLVSDRAVYDLTPEAFASAMHSVVDAGASMVGGCCGTTPAHIRALGAAVGGRRRA